MHLLDRADIKQRKCMMLNQKKLLFSRQSRQGHQFRIRYQKVTLHCGPATQLNGLVPVKTFEIRAILSCQFGLRFVCGFVAG